MFKRVFLCLLISFQFCQCYNKKANTVPDKTEIPLKDSLLLVHAKDHHIAITSARIHNDFIHGYVVPLNYEPPRPNKVHICLDSTFSLDNKMSGTVSIPLWAVVEPKTTEDKLRTLKSESQANTTKRAVIGGVIGGMSMILTIAITPENENEYMHISDAQKMAIFAPITATVGAFIGVSIGGSQESQPDSTAGKDPFLNDFLY